MLCGRDIIFTVQQETVHDTQVGANLVVLLFRGYLVDPGPSVKNVIHGLPDDVILRGNPLYGIHVICHANYCTHVKGFVILNSRFH